MKYCLVLAESSWPQNFILQFTFICNSLIHIIQSISCINLYGGLLQKVIIAVDGIRCCQNIHGFFLIFYFDEFKNFQKIILFSMQYLHTHASYLHFTYMWSKFFTYYLHENFWKHILLRVEHILFLCLSLGQFKICNEKKNILLVSVINFTTSNWKKKLFRHWGLSL